MKRLKAEWEQNHEMVLSSGGLHHWFLERHESRRIDNQLRGRAGRQGDLVCHVLLVALKMT